MYAPLTRLRPLILAGLAGLSTLTLPACDDGDDGNDDGATGLAIVGDYVDGFGFDHSVSEDQWVSGDASWAIAEYDNDAMYLVAQNAADNMFSPGAWSRFDWTWDGEDLYYCQSVFDGATIDDARDGSADASDLTSGCSGFGWSLLTPI